MSSQYFAGKFSQLTSQACVIDTTPPTFAGIASAVFQLDGSALVSWASGTSTKTPVRYEIYVSPGSVTAASLFVTANRVAFAPGALTSWRIFVLRDQVTYFMPGQQYTFGIRAVDSQNYTETNTVVIVQTATYPNYGSLAATVWDQPKSAHTISGSFGDYLDAKVSLAQTAATALTQYNNIQSAIALLQPAATALTQYNAIISAVGSPQQASVALSQYNNLISGLNTILSDVLSIPTNPLLSTDSRLNNLDTPISTRQAAATALTQYNALVTLLNTSITDITAIPTNPLLTSDVRLNHLDANISATQTAATALSQYNNLQSAITLLQLASVALTQFNSIISAIGGITPPDNSSIAAIKAKTDNLPSDPASNTQVNTRLPTSSYVAPDNADIAAIKTKTDQLTFAIDGVNAHVNNVTPVDYEAVADAVWDEPTSEHTSVGSFGKNAQTPAIDSQQVADAVWNEPLSPNHLSPGTAGKTLHDGGGGSGGGSGFGIAEAAAIQPSIANAEAYQPEIVEAIALDDE